MSATVAASAPEPKNNSGICSRPSTTQIAIAAWNTTPSAIAAKPARRAAPASRRPTAWPTRTVAAMPIPSGTMKTIAAVCSATWCAASATVPMIPMSSAADANTPCSSRNVAEIGSPIAISWRNNGQS